MATPWYPGHMNKARRVIAEALPTKDVVIEVLDARMPKASSNPVLTRLRRGKPCVKVLCKSDLADPAVTAEWLSFLERREPDNVVALALSKMRPEEIRTKVVGACQRLAPNRSGPGKMVRALIVGIPNVGKSTLINTLMERKVAKVGDEPAVTKAEQLVTLKSGMLVSDHPGILWPSIEDEAAMILAVGGAIPDTVLDYEEAGFFAAKAFLEHYPQRLVERFKLDPLPDSPLDLLEAIGRKTGCLRAGGVVDRQKAGGHLVHAFRSGKLGRISLERPDPAADAQLEDTDATDLDDA